MVKNSVVKSAFRWGKGTLVGITLSRGQCIIILGPIFVLTIFAKTRDFTNFRSSSRNSNFSLSKESSADHCEQFFSTPSCSNTNWQLNIAKSERMVKFENPSGRNKVQTLARFRQNFQKCPEYDQWLFFSKKKKSWNFVYIVAKKWRCQNDEFFFLEKINR